MKKTKLKNQSKTERARLVKRLDELTRQIVFRDSPNYCVVCGTSAMLQLGHIFSRTTYSTRWDFKEGGNTCVQCSGCNLRHEYDPYPLFNWYMTKFGKDRFDELHARYKAVNPIKTFELKELVTLMEEEANG